jgi:hydrogenase expression/formation protein HypC
VCIELPGRVVDLPADRPNVARIDVAGTIRSVHLGLLDGEPPQVGDWVALHLGFAVAKITEAEAAEAIAFAEGDWDWRIDDVLETAALEDARPEVEDARLTVSVLAEGSDDPFADFTFGDDAYAPAGHGESVS